MKAVSLGSVLMLSIVNLAYADTCNTYNSIAQDSTKTVDERHEAAKSYRSCLVKSMGATPQEMVIARSTAPVEEAKAQEEDLAGKKKFMGQNFGIGFAISFYDGDIVSDAEIVNGVVVAKSKKDKEARVLLEFHTLIACNKGRTNTDFGCGPFAALATKENDVLGGVGLGWLWSWRNKAASDGSGFSIGVGAILDNDVKDLADGFHVGKAPPNGETTIRYTSEPKTSWLLFMSNNF